MAAGDPHALRQLNSRYAPILTAIGLRFFRNEPEAAEVAADTLWQAWSDAQSYDAGRGSVGAWLMTLARRRARDRLRRTGKLEEGAARPAYLLPTGAAAEHQKIAGLIPLAAVDRLEADELRQVQKHLRDHCGQCEHELREWRQSAAALAASGAEARLWQRLEARLHAQVAAAHLLASTVSRPRRIGGERQSSVGWWRGVAAVAAVAAILLLAYNRIVSTRARRAEVRQLGQLESLSWQINNLHSELGAAQMEIESLRSEADLQSRFARLLMAPDVQLITLAAAGPVRRAAGLVALSYASHAAMVRIEGLPPAPPGKNYEVWWITKQGAAVRAGLLLAQSGRPAIAALALPPAGERPALITVTLEDADGKSRRGGATYLKGAPERE
jgi:DNA-directed RNA polymerase specialized sigma24 family protein